MIIGAKVKADRGYRILCVCDECGKDVWKGFSVAKRMKRHFCNQTHKLEYMRMHKKEWYKNHDGPRKVKKEDKVIAEADISEVWYLKEVNQLVFELSPNECLRVYSDKFPQNSGAYQIIIKDKEAK